MAAAASAAAAGASSAAASASSASGSSASAAAAAASAAGTHSFPTLALYECFISPLGWNCCFVFGSAKAGSNVDVCMQMNVK